MPDERSEVSPPEEETVIEYHGAKFRVVHCRGAMDSFDAALKHCQKGKANSLRRGMEQQIARLADGHRMSKENFPSEGDLPKLSGHTSAKKFNALKRKPIRGYCWLSEKYLNTYFISHYIYKNFQKLNSKDTDRVASNWKRIEVDEDEF